MGRQAIEFHLGDVRKGGGRKTVRIKTVKRQKAEENKHSSTRLVTTNELGNMI